MQLYLRGWRTALLTSLGVGAAVGCGGATDGGLADGASGAGAGESVGGNAAGMGGGGGTGGNFTFGGVGAGGAVARGGSGGSAARQCQNPRQYPPITMMGDHANGAPALAPIDTGFAECDGGWLHRPRARECPSRLPRAEVQSVVADAPCSRDSDCTEKPHGYCRGSNFASSPGAAPPGPGNPAGPPQCVYGCIQDAECGAGSICLCGDPVGVCTPSNCTTNADCASGLCVATPPSGCGVTFTMGCHQVEDECLASADCGATRMCAPGIEARTCSPMPVCGRPFLVHDAPRTAPSVSGSHSWSERATEPSDGALEPAARSALAAHWTEIALMEHASVAAFARFVLELLSLGAPCELVQETQRALADEIEHTVLCFTLASGYAGQAVSAGALSIEGALATRSRQQIVTTAFLEACVGETLAAVEARAALETALDPAVRRVLARIAADEARHAELGWKFLQWALATSSVGERNALCSALSRIVAEESGRRPAHAEGSSDGALQAHGLLSDARRWQARQLALSELVQPLAAALLQPLAMAPVGTLPVAHSQGKQACL